MKTVFQLIEENGLTLHGDIEHFAELVRAEALAKPDFWEGYEPEPVKPAQQALDKKAENARELGLDYEPAQPRAWFTIDELNAWADKKLKENPQWAEQSAQRTWVGLTDEEIARVVSLAGFSPDWAEAHIATQIVRVLEAKLKEKNT